MKACVADTSIKKLDQLIMPAKTIDPNNINMKSPLLQKIRGFTLNLGLVHKYKQQSRSFGSRVVPWKTKFEVETGKKLLINEDQLFQLYNYVTTNSSQFGSLIRMLNDRSSDKWKARYFYDHGHSLTSINQPYRDTCWKYYHQFPKRLQTSCPGRGKCNAENACKPCDEPNSCKLCRLNKCRFKNWFK